MRVTITPGAQSAAMAAFGMFLVVAAALALVVLATLVWPRSLLAAIWLAKPGAFGPLLRARPAASAGFAALAAVLAVASVHWRLRRRSGWRLAVLVIATNLAADVAMLAAARQPVDLVAPCIGGLVLVWLLTPATRSRFLSRGHDHGPA